MFIVIALQQNMMSAITYTPNFVKISYTPHIPGYYQVPLETTQPIDLLGNDVTFDILVNNIVVHQVDIDEILTDITIGDYTAIININPDPSNSTVMGHMFVPMNGIDIEALHGAVQIVGKW